MVVIDIEFVKFLDTLPRVIVKLLANKDMVQGPMDVLKDMGCEDSNPNWAAHLVPARSLIELLSCQNFNRFVGCWNKRILPFWYQ
jgi:hypothetical protein